MNSSLLTPNRVNIKEANDHLQLLYLRINELENIIQSQTKESIKLEKIHLKEMQDLKMVKDDYIQKMSDKIVSLEAKIKTLEAQEFERKEKLNKLQTRLSLLDHFIINMSPCLEGLMNEISKLSTSQKNFFKDESNDDRASSGIGLISASNGSMSDTTFNTDISESDIYKSELSDNQNLSDYYNSKKLKSSLVNMALKSVQKTSFKNCDNDKESLNGRCSQSSHQYLKPCNDRGYLSSDFDQSSLDANNVKKVFKNNLINQQNKNKAAKSFSITSNFSDEETS